ncbi:MAG: hypothetical protein HY088_01170 [Ignavibacteriales bacterium]|nr:hypothetical protein [Ignavibacteriales bacterium]
MNLRKSPLFWVAIFAIAFAFVESSVVVYLRALYYPQGFSLPLKIISRHHIYIELAREFSTIMMLVAVGALAGATRWQKFSYFMIAFGVWDIFFYVWLKVCINWPASLLDWDILFLLPVPWIGPVLAPVLISVLMIIGGVFIIKKEAEEGKFHPTKLVWFLTILGTAIILYSFTSDFRATLKLQLPNPYHYELLAIGLGFYLAGMAAAFRKQQR